jgi:hypothetical protein
VPRDGRGARAARLRVVVVRLGDDLEGLFEDFPEFYGFVFKAN